MADADIRFDLPCHEPWDAMRPQGRTRYCLRCDKAVHDLDLYTVEEIEALLAPGNPPLCLAARIAPDGSVATRAGRAGRTLTAAVSLGLLPLAAAAAATPAGTGPTVAATGHGTRQHDNDQVHHGASHHPTPVPPPILMRTAGIVVPPSLPAPQDVRPTPNEAAPSTD